METEIMANSHFPSRLELGDFSKSEATFFKLCPLTEAQLYEGEYNSKHKAYKNGDVCQDKQDILPAIIKPGNTSI